MGNAEWAGVSLADVLDLAGVKDSAVEVMFEGADHGADEVVGDPKEVTYERSLPLAKATHADTLLAYEMNGEPLPQAHGFPLRLLVSGWYGMNSVKWVTGIHVLDHEFQGFYMTDRYMTLNEPGNPVPYRYYTKLRVKSIVTNPAPGEIVPVTGYTHGRCCLVGGRGHSQSRDKRRRRSNLEPGRPALPADWVLVEQVGALLAASGTRPLHRDVQSHQQQGRNPAYGIPQQMGRPWLRQQHGIPE